MIIDCATKAFGSGRLNNPFSRRSASACEKPPNDEVRVMFTVGWLVVLFGVLAMRWADGCFPSLDFKTSNV